MKRLLIMSFLMLACQMLQAVPITKEKAKESAVRFLHQKNGTALAHSRDMRQVNVNLMNDEESANDAFYVFNIGKAEGFVIVSNDDCTDDILGYADKGEIIPEDMPENMKAWLQGYADEIKWMRDHHIGGKADAGARRRAAVKTMIAPLLKTTWDQGEPYNNNCPVFVTGTTRCVTGCVATAMAQVLNYHGQKNRGPAQTLATIPAYDCNTNWGGNWDGYKKVHVDEIQAGVVFNWNNMLNDYSGNASDAQKTAVATLMQCCGASVCMEYKDQDHGSSASDYNVPLALKTYFGYDADTRYVRRVDYTIMDWNNLIYSELASDRPVFYGGRSTGGGHAFVVDGYDGDGFFHVNWGWGGYCDGNFRLSALDPESNSGIGASSTKDGYNTGQDAIIGAQPSTGSAVEVDNSLLLGNIKGVSGTSINVDYTNWSGKQNSFNYGIGYMSNGTIVLASAEGTCNLPNETYISPNVQISNLADGSYKLFPISKVTTSTIWKTNVDVERDYVLAEVSNEIITLTINTLTPHLAVSAMTFSGMQYVNNTQNVEVTITNTDGDEFTGYVYMFVSQTENMGTFVNKKNIAVTKNGNTTIDMSFLPTAAGTYTVWICSDEAGTNILGSGSVTIESISNVNNSDLQIIACSFDGEDPSTLRPDDDGSPNQITDIYTNNVVAHITVKNMTSETKAFNYVFLISKHNGSNYPDVTFNGVEYQILQLSSGGTYSFDLNLGSLEYGKRYKIILQKLEIVNSSLQSQSKYDDHVRFKTVSGYSAWTENGVKSVVETTEQTLTIANDVVAVDLSGYTFTNVTANSNPNTLYYLSANQEIPAGLTGKNVIKGNSATKIQLQDGYPFYVPTAFSADEITYTRRFTTAASTTTSGGWSTMVIPFNVDVVKVGDKTLSWFQSDDDSNKDFWLMQFSSDETDQVNFGYTNKICANYPYLIAVPGDNWGEEHRLTGKDIVFSATTATVTSTSRAMLSGDFYTMYGTYAPKTIGTDAYVLNSTGSGFVKKSNSVTLRPFRAYFLPKYGYGSHAALSIGMTGNQTTGITPLFHDTPTTANDVYNISGVKVGNVDNMQQLKPGIYIVNGKKIVKQ